MNGETEPAALCREAREEIGGEIDITEKIGVAAEYFRKIYFKNL